MTQEEKSLLLKDLCARVYYGVLFMVHDDEINEPVELLSINPKRDKPLEIDDGYDEKSSTYWNLEDAKPYLRPMSSMTEEEIKEFSVLGVGIHLFKGPLIPSYDTLDWLNKKMFAYRTIDGKDMFELGLAFEAPEGMYKKWTSLRGNLKEDNQGNIVGGLKL